MLDRILSVLGVFLLLFSAYAVVMCLWVAGQASKAEEEFWRTHRTDEKHARTSTSETGRI